MMNFSDIKTGKKIVIDGQPFTVTYHEHSKTGRAGAVLRTKIKNLATGAVQEKIFHGSDKVEEADISKTKAQFLYAEGSGKEESFNFMDNETFEQSTLSGDVLGDVTKFLTEGTEVTMLNFNGIPINVEPPIKVTLEVTDAPPGIKGDTSSGGDKLVTTQTGFTVTTPLHINTGDQIIINTETGTYVSKVS